MRSFILIIFCLFCLAIGFLVYYWVQPKHRLAPEQAQQNQRPIRTPRVIDNGQMPGGGNVLVNTYDNEGRLIRSFSASEYNPQSDGRMAVVKPKVDFYLTNHQRLRIEGKDGLVTVEPSDRHRNPYGQPTSTQPPRRGELHDVVVSLFDAADDVHPALTVVMNNASFDSDTFRINTEPFVDPQTGHRVPADMVPVTVTGRDYDFKGRGMTIRWNDRDRRLQLLEIQHGEVLVMKHPREFGPMNGLPGNQTAAVTQPTARIPMRMGPIDLYHLTPTALLTTGPATRPPGRVGRTPRPPAATGEALEARTVAPTEKPNIRPSNDPPFYRADFEDHVRIVQNGQQLITADQMLVDFLLKEDQSPATGPATESATAPAVAAKTSPATRTAPRVARRPAATRPGTAPATQAATDSAEEPIYVYWTGALRVTPRQLDAPVSPGESIITFQGAPVIAQQQGSEIRAASLTYKNEDGSTYAQESPTVPLMLMRTDARGVVSTVHAASLMYSRTTQLAVLRGKGDAHLPVQSDVKDAPPQALDAKWSQSCTLHFAGKNENEMAIDTADLEGEVRVHHPQMVLASQSLELSFDTAAHPATQPATKPEAGGAQSNLRKLIATGDVHCQMIDPQQTKTIDTDRLMVLTEAGPDGRMVPHTITADGRVHTVTPDEDLHAGHLAALVGPVPPATSPATVPTTLASATQPSLQLQSLTASDHVEVTMKDGTIAHADTLLVNSTAGKPTVKLLGTPYATVNARQSTMQGPIIDVVPDSQQLMIDGPGSMRGSQQAAPGAAARPIDITWTRNVQYDGLANTIDCIGQVKAKTVDADGTVNVASGDRMRINLIDLPPATRPATEPATQVTIAATLPSSQPTTAPANGLFANKALQQVTFTDPTNSEIHSTLTDPATGKVVREVDLFATTIEFYNDLKDGQPMRRLVIPVAGRMLVEDHRPRSSTQPANAESSGGMGDARGTTAFQWTKRMTYDEATQKVILEGGDSVVEAEKVIVDHRDDVPNPEPMRLAAREVTATIVPVPASQPATRVSAATQPATTQSATTQPTEPRFEIKRLTAAGNLVLYVKGGIMHADHMDFDPIAHLMHLYGSGNQQAVYEHDPEPGKPPQHFAADELIWDLAQNLPHAAGVSGEMRK